MSTTVYFRAANIAACDAWGPGNGSNWNPNSVFATSGGSGISSTRLSRGAVSGGTEATATTVTSGTTPKGFLFTDSVSQAFWVTPPLDRDVTIASTITFNLWMRESNMAANIGAGCYIARIGPDGTLSAAIANSEKGTEMAYGTAGSQTAQNWTVDATDLACHRGDRLLIVPFFNHVGTQASGYSGFFYYDGDTAGASGDSYVTFTEDFGFMEGVPDAAATATGTTSTNFGNVNGSARIGVRFYSSKVQTLTATKLEVWKNGNPLDNFVLALQGESAGKPSGTDLATATIAGTSLGTSRAQVTCDLADYTLAADTYYWLVLRRSSGQDPSNYYFYGSSTTGIGIGPNRFGEASVYDAGLASWGTVSGDVLPGNAQLNFTAGSTLYPTTAAGGVDPNGATYDSKDLWTSRGSGNTQAVVNTAAAPASPLLFTTSAGGNYIEWFSKPLTAFTLAGPVDIFISRTQESNAAANATVGAELAICANDGTSSTVWAKTIHGLEALVSPSTVDREFFLAGDDVAVTDGQRIRLRIYADDASAAAMAATYTVTVTYAGTSGGNPGDTYLTFGQTLTEYVTGTNYPQAIDASLTGTLALVRRTGKPVAVVPAGATVGIARGIRKPVPVTPTLDISAAKRVAKPLSAATTTVTAGVARRTAKAIPATSTATINLATQKVKQLAIAVTSTIGAALARTIVKPVAISTTATIAFVRNVGKPISRTTVMSLGQGPTKDIRKPVATATSGTVTLARGVRKPVPVSFVGTASLLVRKAVGQTIAVGMTGTVALARRVGKLIDAAATGTVVIARKTGKAVAVGMTGTVSVTKTIPKAIAASVTGTVALARTIWKYISITGTAGGVTPALANTAEGGSNGTTVTSGTGGNSGGTSGDYFDGVTGAVTFDNAHPAHGSLGYKFVQSGTGANYLEWTRGLSGKTVFSRGYLYIGTFAGTQFVYAPTDAAGTQILARLRLTAAGVLQWVDNFGSTVGTTYTISTATLYRVETQVFSSGGAGTVEARIYLGDATTATATISATGVATGGNDVGRARFGAATVTGGSSLTCWWDDLAIGITDWLGVPGGGTQMFTVGLTQRKTVQKLIDATVTVTAAVARKVGKAVQVATTATVDLARNVRKPISIGSTLDAVIQTVKNAGSHVYNQAVDVATTITAAISRRMPKAVDATATMTAAIARRTGKIVTVGLTGTVNLARSAGKLLAVGMTSTVSLGRRANKLIAVALSPGFTLARSIGKPISVGGTMAVALAKRIAKSVPVSMTVTAVVAAIKSVSQAISVGLTAGVSLARRTAKSIAPALSLTLAISRAVAKPVTVALSAGISLVRRTAKTVPVALSAGITILAGAAHRQLVAVGATLSLAIATAKTKLQAVAASMTGTVALARRVGKPVAVGASLSVSLVRSVPRAIAVGTSLTVGVSKRMARLVAVGLTGTVSLAASKTKVVAVAVASTIGVALRKGTTEAISVGVSLGVSIRRAMAKAVPVAVNPGVSIAKSVGKRISATSSLTVGLVRSFAKLIAASSPVQATLDAVANIANVNIPQAISVGVSAVVAVSRAITHQVGVEATMVAQVAKRLFVSIAANTVNTVTILTAKTKAQLVAVAMTIGVSLKASAGKLIAATTSLAVDLVREIGFRIEVSLLLQPRIRKAITKTVEFTTEIVAVVKALFSGFSTGKDHRGPTSARSTSPKATEADIGREGTDAVVDAEQTDADRWG